MSYATLAQVKRELDITGTNDDDLLTDAINDATAAIETHTGRKFGVQTNTTKYFTIGEHTDGYILRFDMGQECFEIDSITNGDGTVITSAQYTTKPRSETPFHSVKLLLSSGVVWLTTDGGDADDAIAISAKWGFSESPPDDIRRACVRWAGFFYRQKDAQVYDVTATPELGQITIPQGIPADVQRMLRPYRMRS